jgi:hypothetical protein
MPVVIHIVEALVTNHSAELKLFQTQSVKGCNLRSRPFQDAGPQAEAK